MSKETPISLGIAKDSNTHQYLLIADTTMPVNIQLPIDLLTILRAVRQFAPQVWDQVSREVIAPAPRRLIGLNGESIEPGRNGEPTDI